jgi:hypothetical protein
MRPDVIDYQLPSTLEQRHLDAPVRHTASRASVICFAIPASAVAVGIAVTRAGAGSVGQGIVIVGFMLGLVFCPSGLVMGVVGLFAPDGRRFAAAIGTALNASAIMLVVRPVLHW